MVSISTINGQMDNTERGEITKSGLDLRSIYSGGSNRMLTVEGLYNVIIKCIVAIVLRGV